MLKKVGVLVAVVAITGCESTPTVEPGLSRFDSPEVHSEAFNVRASLGFEGKNIVSEDGLSESNNHSLRADVAVTLGKGVEVSYLYSTDTKVALKYQFYGAPKEQLKVGNVSQAVSIGYVKSPEQSGRKKDRRWSQRYDYLDLAWVTGYRVAADKLIYGGVFYQRGEATGENYKFNFELDCDWDSNSQRCFLNDFQTDGTNYGVNVGFEYQFNTWSSVMLEFVHGNAKWYGNSHTESAFGANFSYHF